MNPIIPLGALAVAVLAVTKSDRKLRTLLYLLGWTLGVSAGAGLLAFILAKTGYFHAGSAHDILNEDLRAGNSSAVAGDVAGPVMTLTLLFSPINRLRVKRVAQTQKCEHVNEVGDYCTKCRTNLEKVMAESHHK